MGPMKLYFDVRDVFRAPRLALSGKKIWVFLVANLIGWAVYWILTNIALSISGYAFSDTWSNYHLYPCLFNHEASWISWVIYWIGILVWFFALNLGCTTVARISYKQLKGDEFYSSGDAFKFVRKHWHPVIFTWISILLILVFFIIGAIILALIGKIPYVGEFLFVLPYLLYFFGSVFTVYTAVVFLLSLIYTPAIVGAYEEDTMGTVFQSYSLTWSQPWRIVLYHLVLLPIAYIGVVVFKYFWLGGYHLINTVFGQGWLMGTKLSNIVSFATDIVNPLTVTSSQCTGWLCTPMDNVMSLSMGASLSGTELVTGVILTVFLFILFFSFISYALSIFSVGEVLMFVIFKKKSDDDNLLERKDEEELEEEEEEDQEFGDFDEDTDEDDSDKEDTSSETPDDDETSGTVESEEKED